MLHPGFSPLLEALKATIAASSLKAPSAHLALALKLAEQGDALCREGADLTNLVTARRLARQCAEQIHAAPEGLKSAVSGSRRALSALFVELDERIASAPA